jgi:uncharacterized protein HemY
MLTQRWRPVVLSLLGILTVWVVAMGGYYLAKSSRVTAEKVKTYMQETDLSRLSPAKRAGAIHELADQINALPYEERRKARLDRSSASWMGQMTDAEKTEFVEATLPTGFKQMLAAFEELPEDRRRRIVDDAIKRLREVESRIRAGADGPEAAAGMGPSVSPELQAKIRTLGLKAFYSESSAQTKAELAPVLEELQRVMESGRAFHGR